jgi:hypothetical protein
MPEMMRLLPRHFCWTKFGTEAGQTVEQILRRKDEERRRNDGIFLWGIGNSLGNSVNELLLRASAPEILFSPIKASARHCDSDPPEVLAWRAAETFQGDEFLLPRWSLVTSRQTRERPKASHYALVCYSSVPLQLVTDGPVIDFAYLTNLATGHRLGPSQVTAIVERTDHAVGSHREYVVALRATLIAPFFVRLRNPVPIPAARGTCSWSDAVQAFWAGAGSQTDAAR